MSRTQAADRLQVLVIEDDETIGRHLLAGLLGNGYEAYWCRTGAAGLTRARESPPDVVLLDLGLPDIDGIEVARALRAEQPDLLIIILTARSDEIDVIVRLDAGADDYLVKPFNLTVLLARLRAHLRRRPAAATGTDPIRVADLVVDVAARRCLLGDREIDLRPKEFELLVALARHPGVAVTREDLMAQVWDQNWFGSTKTLDVTMAALRRRLSEGAPSTTTPEGLGLPNIHHTARSRLPPRATTVGIASPAIPRKERTIECPTCSSAHRAIHTQANHAPSDQVSSGQRLPVPFPGDEAGYRWTAATTDRGLSSRPVHGE